MNKGNYQFRRKYLFLTVLISFLFIQQASATLIQICVTNPNTGAVNCHSANVSWTCEEILNWWANSSNISCKVLTMANNTPKIMVNSKNAVFVIYNGKVLPFISDNAHFALEQNLSQLKRKDITKEQFLEKMEILMKNDDGIVSKGNLDKLSKELEVSVIYTPTFEMNTTSTKKGDITNPKRNCCLLNSIIETVYFGGGFISPSTEGKENAYLTSSIGFNLNFYKGFTTKQTVGFGINYGADYYSSNRDQLSTLPQSYAIIGQTSSNVKMINEPINQRTFRFGLGPQVNFTISKCFVVSTLFQAGYSNTTQKGFRVVQTTAINSSIPITKSYTMLSTGDTKTEGVGFYPKLRLVYKVKSWGIWAEGNYNIDPSINTSVSTYKPREGAVAGQYTIDDMDSGTTTTTNKKVKNNSAGFSVGISFSCKK